MIAGAEAGLESVVHWLRLAIEGMGALVIVVGVFAALREIVRRGGFDPVRLIFARYLALALEFQLAADILSTAIAPSWEQIGKLAAIAVIRTALNYFLQKEIEMVEGQARGPVT